MPHGKRHPTLAENVVVGAGAKVLGAINVGAHEVLHGIIDKHVENLSTEDRTKLITV